MVISFPQIRNIPTKKSAYNKPETGFGSFTAAAKYGTQRPAHEYGTRPSVSCRIHAPGILFHTLQPWKIHIPLRLFMEGGGGLSRGRGRGSCPGGSYRHPTANPWLGAGGGGAGRGENAGWCPTSALWTNIIMWAVSINIKLIYYKKQQKLIDCRFYTLSTPKVIFRATNRNKRGVKFTHETKMVILRGSYRISP